MGGGDKGSAEQGIQQAGQGISAAGAMTPQETQQYGGSFDIGNILNALYKYQLGLGGAPSGYLSPEAQYQQQGPLAQGLYGQTMQNLQNPYANYSSNLQPSLQAAEDYINRRAQQRGLYSSGIPIEQMGRAGVDLAIQEADKRNQAYQQSLQQAAGLSQYSQGLQQQNIGNLANLYGTQQQAGLQAKGRGLQAQTAASQYQAYPYQSSLGDYYGSQGQAGMGIGAGVGTLLGGIAGTAIMPGYGTLIGAGLGAGAGAGIGGAFR